MGQKQRYSKENYRIMLPVGAPRNSKKRKHDTFKCEIPIFNPFLYEGVGGWDDSQKVLKHNSD